MPKPSDAPDARLTVVGLGLQPGRHVGERARSEIRLADRVFAIGDPWMLAWLREFNSDVVDLGAHYADDRDRRDSYADMHDRVLDAVRTGLRVCVALYGHPGVFADIGHRAIASARADGIPAFMEPGVSAEACLYADLGLDPGDSGVQSYEATQFLVQRRDVDPHALLLLWQVALTGNLECTGFEPDPARLAVLVDKLTRWYPRDHEVTLYEAAALPIADPRAERISLSALPGASLNSATTLVVPPLGPAPADRAVRDRLGRP